ncbi:hypothetical protein RJ641_002341 [Dillenia turbinata]|uniref:Uncharacterized protein n=1 Tax=Dillenia turbinata TaxID=194707 RepID=A0AAN8ZCF2_9MAGN
MRETVRELRGHGATATCCAAFRHRPGLIATSGEVSCNLRSSFLATADDGGDVKDAAVVSRTLWQSSLVAMIQSLCCGTSQKGVHKKLWILVIIFTDLCHLNSFRAFSLFEDKGILIISGGNDKLVKVWDVEETGSSNDLL